MTFTISTDGKSITCHDCGKTSHNPNDVAQCYCGWCNKFHDNIWPDEGTLVQSKDGTWHKLNDLKP